MEADTKEAITIGKLEINKRPMRIKVYTVIDGLNQITNLILQQQDTEGRNVILDKLKDLKRQINEL